jgi:hypothetical protein
MVNGIVEGLAGDGGNTATGNSATSSSSNERLSDLSPSEILEKILTRSNLMILVWFLVVYFIVYFMVKILTPSSDSSSDSDRMRGGRRHYAGGDVSNTVVEMFDLASLGIFLIYLVYTTATKTDEERRRWGADTYAWWKDTVNHPFSIFSIGLFIFLLYAIVYVVGIPMSSDDKPATVMIIENGAWILMIMTIIVAFFKYILGISITDMIDKWLNGLPESEEPSQKPAQNGNNIAKNEVFNVKNNIYTYDDAQSVCKSMGARLATYDEVENTYEEGGEWCNYGWSEGQMALFPTQKTTFEELQKTKDRKNACGRPGINGGYIGDTKVRFGVNCYGKKPKAKDKDIAALAANAGSMSVLPKSAEDIIMEKKVQFWKDNADKLIEVNSYNNKKWSEY